MKTYLYLLLLIATCISCTPNSKKNDNSESTGTSNVIDSLYYVEKNTTFAQYLSSEQSPIKAAVDLIEVDSSAFGSVYLFDSQNNTVFTSSIDLIENGTFILLDEIKVLKSLRLLDNNIELIYTDSATNTNSKISLLKSSKQYQPAKFINYYRENCDSTNKPNSPAQYKEFCDYISISYPAFSLKNRTAEKLLNDSILRIIHGDEYASVGDFLKKLDKGVELIHNEDVHFGIKVNTDKIICVELKYHIFAGGAHGSSYFGFTNFNVENGKIIRMTDLINSDSVIEIQNLLYHKIKQWECNWIDDAALGFKKEDININNFAITPVGLEFRFNQYEVGPYACGAPTFLLEYKDLNNILNETGKSLTKPVVDYYFN